MDKLSDQDKAMIVYFWEEKGDLTRWCGWEEKKPLIEAEFPWLINALKNLEFAEKSVDLMVNAISDHIEW